MSADLQDPDQLAQLVVQQYLKDNGLHKALRAMEHDTGLLFLDSKLPRGSMLMEMVYAHLEQASELDAGDAAAAAALLREEEEQLNQPADAAAMPCNLAHNIAAAHTAAVISVQCCSGESAVIIGSGNSEVRKVGYGGEVRWCTSVGGGGVLSLALQPPARPGKQLLLAGSMDGSVSLLDAETGTLLHSAKPHLKYVVSVVWTGDGHRFISGSWDATVAVHCTTAAAAVGSSQALEAAAADDCGGDVGSFETLKVIRYGAQVQAVAFLADGDTAVVAVRDSNYLRLLSAATLQEVGRKNMNAQKYNDHVSFYASHLALSPCGKMLLVSTEGPRILVFRVKDWKQTHSICGLPTAEFHQPCAVWLHSSAYVAAAAAGGQVFFFHVPTGKVVVSVRAHPASSVRSLAYDPQSGALATCSFDRTVQIFKRNDCC